MNFIKLYLAALPVFVLLDALWIGVISKGFYQKHLGYLFTDRVNYIAAATFYLLFLAGLVFFVLTPSLEKKTWVYALFAGALFGLVTYATYDLTNLATVKNWPLVVTVVDLIWGAAVSALVSMITFFVAVKLKL